MALFTYKAINQLGETEEGTRDVADEQALITALQSEGLIPVHVAAVVTALFLVWVLVLKPQN